MKNANALIEQVKNLGASLVVGDGGVLKIRMQQPLPADLVDTLKSCKAEILQLLVLTPDERAAVAYCEEVAKEREAGRNPASYTSTTFCAGGCGHVYIFPEAASRVDSCPWCRNRVRGLPIPRP